METKGAGVVIDRREILKTWLLSSGAALLAAAGLPVAAAGFPSRSVKLTTPFSAGAGPDAVLRLLGEGLAKKWGQVVVVDNKPGGSGFIAYSSFRQGVADGHELIQLDSNHISTHPHTFSKLPYNVEQDLVPIAMLLRTPFFIAVAADSPFKSVDDLLAAAKAKPDGVTYGSWFNGSPGHIGALRLQALKNVQMLHVAYRDFGMLYTAVASKEVDWALASVASAGALERAGKLRFLALAAAQRDPLYPNVPCTAELPSLRGFEVDAWTGLFGPKAMPAAVRTQIATDLGAVMALPEVLERYRTLGYEAPKVSLKAFEDLIRRETQAWGAVIKSANLKLD